MMTFNNSFYFSKEKQKARKLCGPFLAIYHQGNAMIETEPTGS